MTPTTTGDDSPRCSSTTMTRSIYLEHRGRESAVVCFMFEMVQGLMMIEDEAEDQVD